MVIRTYQSFSGYVATEPVTEPTKKGVPRFYARAGQRQARKEPNGAFTRLPTQYMPIVALGAIAEEAAALLRKGDSFTAEGRIRPVRYETKEGKSVEGEEFEVWRIGRHLNDAEWSAPAAGEVPAQAHSRGVPPEFTVPRAAGQPSSVLAM